MHVFSPHAQAFRRAYPSKLDMTPSKRRVAPEPASPARASEGASATDATGFTGATVTATVAATEAEAAPLPDLFTVPAELVCCGCCRMCMSVFLCVVLPCVLLCVAFLSSLLVCLCNVRLRVRACGTPSRMRVRGACVCVFSLCVCHTASVVAVGPHRAPATRAAVPQRGQRACRHRRKAEEHECARARSRPLLQIQVCHVGDRRGRGHCRDCAVSGAGAWAPGASHSVCGVHVRALMCCAHVSMRVRGRTCVCMYMAFVYVSSSLPCDCIPLCVHVYTCVLLLLLCRRGVRQAMGKCHGQSPQRVRRPSSLIPSSRSSQMR